MNAARNGNSDWILQTSENIEIRRALKNMAYREY
jgi:hypothetical protein